MSGPSNLTGSQKVNRFLFQKDIINVLNWQAPSDAAGIVGYKVYRDSGLTDLAASISATAPLTYADHNRKPGILYTYYVVSVDGSGNLSSPTSITIP